MVRATLVLLLPGLAIATLAHAGSTPVGAMNGARASGTATLLPDGDVFITGGTDAGGDHPRTAERFDLATSTWLTPAPATLVNAGGPFPTVVRLAAGSLVFVGGFSTRVDRYDPVADSWTNLGDTARTLAGPAAYEVAPGVIMLAGGERTGGIPDVQGERFNTVLATRAALASELEVHDAGPSIQLADGRVVVAGGAHADGTRSLATEVYAPAADTWTAAGPLHAERVASASVVLADGRLLVIGGDCAEVHSLSCYGRTAEALSPTTLKWTSTASLLEPLRDFTATRIADGRVVVIGGEGTDLASSDRVEVYDPGTDQWSWSIPLPAPRTLHTASATPSGILVAGGRVGAATVATALLYVPELFTPPVPDGAVDAGPGGGPDAGHADAGSGAGADATSNPGGGDAGSGPPGAGGGGCASHADGSAPLLLGLVGVALGLRRRRRSAR